MNVEDVGFLFGSTLFSILWFALTGYSLYLAIKKKKTAWIIILSLNFIFGLFLPGILSIIAPAIFLFINRDKKKKKDIPKELSF